LVKADLFPPYLLPIALTFTLPPEGVLKVTHEALKVLCKSGISCSVGIDPIIPGVNDDFDSIKRIVSLVAELVVKHIVSSTYKAKPDNFKPR
jgi:DNA repair photolyase